MTYWKIQLTIEINYIYSKDKEEERVIHLQNHKIEIMSYNKETGVTEELPEELIESFLYRYLFFINIDERYWFYLLIRLFIALQKS